MEKTEKIFVTILCLILIGILATLGILYFEKEKSRNIEDIPVVNKPIVNQEVDISGKYFSGDQAGYYQKLEIAKNNENYRVSISYGGAIKGCSFDGIGTRSENKIELSLKNLQPSFKQNMIITFVGNKATISASGSDNSELMYFCGGGASLAGEYIKGEELKKNTSSLTLESKEWNWIETTYNNDTKIVPKKIGIFRLKFERGKVNIATDCNSASGSYSIDGNKLAIKNIAITEKYCKDSMEGEFVKMLGEIDSYFFKEDGQLVFDLKYDTGSSIFK